MIAFLKKIFNLLSNSKSSDLETIKRQAENAILRNEKKSDIQRWQNNSALFQDWDERTLILGSYILPNSNIIEFGAGNMVLKNSLKKYKSYTPSDIVQRFEETLVCDLNQTIVLDFSKYDVVVFSGVLEYVYDIEKIFAQMSTASINQIVLSYCCSDIIKLSRDKNGWLSDYKKNDLEGIFKKYGFKIENYSEWRQQSLYNLIKK